MLRKIRIAAAAVIFTAVTLLFLDFTGIIHPWVSWAAKIQALEAALALNAAVIILLLLLTLLFGRVYCSVICPLGIWQDIVSHFGGRRKRNRFHFRKERKWLRYSILAVFILLLALGLNSIAALIAPYSAFGRIASTVFAPLGKWATSPATVIVAAVTLVAVSVMAWLAGRLWCNTVCPVGTFLGIFAKISIFKPVIDTNKCNGCTLCARNCKASCINPAEHRIDYGRCVACMDCLKNCRQGAIAYKPFWNMPKNKNNEAVDTSRRRFLAAGLMLASAATLEAKQEKVSSGIAMLEDKKVPARETPVKPAGSVSIKNFSDHCVSCQLCVTKCPSSVLVPSRRLETLMQPEMSFEKGFCSPTCTTCSSVCPAGAIKPIAKEDKASTRVGHAVVIRQNCIGCTLCEKKCPAGAITMVEAKDSKHKIPAVNTERCIGCGACEFNCPAKPQKAIYIEGNSIHSIA